MHACLPTYLPTYLHTYIQTHTHIQRVLNSKRFDKVYRAADWHFSSKSSCHAACVSVCVCENRYNKRSVVRLVILIFAGGPWAHGWHGPTKTHPWCRANVPALWFELLTKLFHFDQFCCINPPGDLGHSRRRQVQLSNVPTQITNSHSVFPVRNLSWLHRDSVSTEHKVMSGHFPVLRVKILSSELPTSRM